MIARPGASYHWSRLIWDTFKLSTIVTFAQPEQRTEELLTE